MSRIEKVLLEIENLRDFYRRTAGLRKGFRQHFRLREESLPDAEKVVAIDEVIFQKKTNNP